MKDTPSFKVSLEDYNVIRAIVDRAEQMFPKKVNRIGLLMDLTACHANGTPLRLDDLLAAGPFDFADDVLSIQDHLDRRTGKLAIYFIPRFAVSREPSHPIGDGTVFPLPPYMQIHRSKSQ